MKTAAAAATAHSPGKAIDESRIENAGTFKSLLFFAALAFAFAILASKATPGFRMVVFLGGVALAAWAWKRTVSDPRLVIRYTVKPLATVSDLIHAWNPEPARLESEYEKSLHQYLKSKLRFEKITRQYGAARVKCDLATGDKVMIELKAGMRSTSKLQRLIGQIELYNREWKGKPVIVVLLGDTEEDLLHDLNRSVEGYSAVRVITKPGEAPVEEHEESKSKVTV